MLLVYTPEITNRIKFIFRLIFGEILGTEVNFVTNKEQFKQYTGAKINYSAARIDSNELHFQSSTLLFETGIKEQHIHVFDWEGSKAFFFTDKTSTFPFDPFAASFYLVSRYEEYLPSLLDKHNRYDAHSSLAYRHGFLQKPIINNWAYKIKATIEKKFPAFSFPEKKYEFIPTLDIDMAYSYKGKGWFRNSGALAKSLLKFNIKQAKERLKVLFNLLEDPYDNYNFQFEIHKKYQLQPIYFFLLADYGNCDKGLPPKSKKLHSLIKSIANKATIGIHPSYSSNTNEEKLNREINLLSFITHQKITKSRQHFLKLTLPLTYQNLITKGIEEDYTMGYAAETGFRASICTPFYFYDLEKDEETTLKIYPFEVMEGTLKDYMKIKPENAITHIKSIIEEIKKVNGTFISLWHNDNLQENGPWKNVYEEMLTITVL